VSARRPTRGRAHLTSLVCDVILGRMSHAVPAVECIGHVGIFTSNIQAMRAFYTEVIGLVVTDDDAEHGLLFLSADPAVEHHHLVLSAVPEGEPLKPVLQQVSFRCRSLEDVVGYFKRFSEGGTKIQYAVTHGNAIGVYFFDPDGNRCEVYWQTGWAARQAFRVSIDLEQPLDAVIAEVEDLVKRHGESGFVEGESTTARTH
jgi:catechol-2,3-dioxygenase